MQVWKLHAGVRHQKLCAPLSFSAFSSFSHRLLAFTSCLEVIFRLNMLSMTRVPILAKLMCRAATSGNA